MCALLVVPQEDGSPKVGYWVNVLFLRELDSWCKQGIEAEAWELCFVTAQTQAGLTTGAASST